MKHPEIHSNFTKASSASAPPIQIECQSQNLQGKDDRNLKSSKLRFNAGIIISGSHTCKIMIGMFLLFSFLIGHLYSQNRELKRMIEKQSSNANELKETLALILLRLPHLSVTEDNNEVPTTDIFDENLVSDELIRPDVRSRRDVNMSSSINKNSSYDDFSDEVQNYRSRSPRRSRDHQHRGKGKCRRDDSSCPKVKDHIKALKLKLKLANIRSRTTAKKLAQYKAEAETSKSKNSLAPFSDAKAIYLIPTGPSVNIKTPEQRIGPWYIGEGNDFGFNEQYWYRDISLDQNGTSIIFNENGLHLIYAQVYYHITLGIGEKPAPMGYRINVKKNDANGLGQFKRALPIAECVPSYPSTFYQTCFTQVVWYIEKGDEIFLEHFANSFPLIEADRQGQTFLGILKFNR